MVFSHFFKTSICSEEKLLSYGFKKKEDKWIYHSSLDSDFYAEVCLQGQSLNVWAIEKSSGEKYVLLDVKSAKGNFIGAMRESVSVLMEDIRQKCFETSDLLPKYLDWIQKEFKTEGEFPWEIAPEYEIFRAPNKKWFALIMNIPLKRIFGDSDEIVHVVNLKAENIPQIVDNKSIFPAWHMNKKYWITVLLTSVTDFNVLCSLTQKSYNLVQKK